MTRSDISTECICLGPTPVLLRNLLRDSTLANCRTATLKGLRRQARGWPVVGAYPGSPIEQVPLIHNPVAKRRGRLLSSRDLCGVSKGSVRVSKACPGVDGACPGSPGMLLSRDSEPGGRGAPLPLTPSPHH